MAAAPLVADPPRLLVSAEAGAETRLSVDFRSPEGAPLRELDVRAETNFGSVSLPRETQPGRYEATLSIPPTDMPRSVLVVFSPRGDEGADVAFALIPVSVRTTLRAKTESRARVSCRVGDRTFGPVSAQRDGRFRLDVILPPGTESAEVRITDDAVNVARHEIRVPVRPHDPLLVTLDRYRLATDGTEIAFVHAFAFDAEGRPLRDARFEARADAGTVSSFTDHGDGVHLARYAPPADGRRGTDRIAVTLRSAGARHDAGERVSLVPGAPASLELAADPVELVAGAGEDVALVATARDAAGNVLSARDVTLHADRGDLSEPGLADDGRLKASLTPPVSVESGSIVVKALLEVGEPSAQPARIELDATPTKLPTSWRAFSLITARVTDDAGAPVAGEVLLFHLARGQGRLEGVAVTNEHGVAFVDFAADPTEEVVTIEAQSTTRPDLRASVHVEKRRGGAFATVDRPAQAAAGGVGSRTVTTDSERRVLTASVVLRLAPGAPASLTASADPAVLPADGAATSKVTALLTDANDNAIDTAPLTFSADRGLVGDPAQTGDGRWRATLTAPVGAGSGSLTVTVEEPGSGLSAEVPVALEPGPAARLELVAKDSSLLADGVATTEVVATVTDETGVPVPAAAVVMTVSAGSARLEDAAPTDDAGETSAVLTAGTVAGDVVVGARVEGTPLSESVTLELLAIGPVVLELEAVPSVIAADGRERSEITARLLDAFGDPMPGEQVRFLHDGPGTLTRNRARSDALGLARTSLTSRHGGVARIEARSESVTSLSQTVEVLVEEGDIVASFVVEEPTCEGEVGFRATTVEATEWEWDWTDDGVVDATTPEPRVVLGAGRHAVTLTVRDAEGREGVSSREIVVHEPPTAVATTDAPLAPSGGSVTIDGTESEAADGGSVTHAWDLDGDGETDSTDAIVDDWSAPDGEAVARLVVTDAEGCTATTTVSAVFGEVPDVAVDVTVLGAAEVPAGNLVSYRIDWRNEGAFLGTDVRLEARLDELLAFESTPAGGVTLSSRAIRWELGDLAPGAAGSFEVRARVAGSLPSVSVPLDHVVTIAAAEPDADSTDDIATARIVAFEEQDVALDLTPDAPAPLEPGDELELTGTVEALSLFAVEGTSVALSWDPALLTDFATDRSAITAPGTATIDLGTVQPGESVPISLRWTVPDVLPAPDALASVVGRVAHVSPDPTPANDADRVDVSLSANPDLWVRLDAIPDRVPTGPGDDVGFEVEYGNAGTTRATGVTLTSRLTPGLVGALVENPDGAVFAGDVLTIQPGTLAPGESRTARATVRVASPLRTTTTQLENETTIDSAEAAIDPQADNRATRTVALEAPPDVWVTLTPPPPAAAGDLVAWRLAAGNSGLRPARDVRVELTLEGALVAHENTSRAVTVARANAPHVAIFELGRLDPGAQVEWTHSLRLASPQAQVDPVVSGLARASTTDTDDASAANDVATAVANVRARPDLAGELTLSDTQVAAGATFDAMPRVSAGGDAPCASGRVLLSWTGDALVETSPISLDVGALAVGDVVEPGPVTLRARDTQLFSTTTETLRLDARCDPSDDDPTNDEDAATVTITAAPSLTVELVGPAAAIAAGEAGLLELRWSNVGTTATGEVTIELEADDAALVDSIAPATVVVPDLAPGASGSRSVSVRAASVLPARRVASTVRASATAVSAPGTSDSVVVDLAGEPDLALSRLQATPIPDPPAASGRVEYDLVVENLGTAPSSGAVLELRRDAALLTLGSSLPPGGSDASGLVQWPLPDIAPGARWRRTVAFELPSSFTAEETTVALDGHVAETFDTDSTNDDLSTSFLVTVGVNLFTAVDLEVLAPPLGAGGAVRARVRIGNSGTKDATNVTLTVRMPPPLVGEVLAVTPGADVTTSSARWFLPSVPAGEAGLLHELVFRVRPELPATANTVTAEATVAADPVANPEQDPSDDTSAATVVASAASDTCVTLEATPVPDPPANGGEVRYVVTVENAGTTTADPMDLVLAHDELLTVSDADGGVEGAGTITWSGLRIEAGEIISRTVVTELPSDFPGLWYAVRARATASSTQDDGTGCAAESLERETVVATVSDLTVRKQLLSRSEVPPRRGTIYDYRLEVVNAGQSSSPGALVVDEYPAEMAVVDAGGGNDTAGRLEWRLPGPIAPGDRFVIDYRLAVRPDLDTGLHVMRNRATVTNDGQDAIRSNDTTVHETTLLLDVDLVVDLRGTANPSPPSPGSLIDYVATVTNAGSETATSASLAIDLGPLAQLDGPSPGTGSDPIVVDLGTVAPGEVRTIPFAARSLAALPAATNDITVTASASAFETDGNPADDSDSVTHVVRARTDLRATLRGVDRNGGALEAGDVIDFELLLENREAQIATSVVATVSHSSELVPEDLGGFTVTGPGALEQALAGTVSVLDPPRTLAFSLRVADRLPSTTNALQACGSLDAAQDDAFPADDSDCADFTATACPELVVTWTLVPPTSPAAPGASLDGTLTVENAGSTDATSVVVEGRRDTVTTTRVLSTDRPLTDSGETFTVDFGSIPAGSTAEASITIDLAPTLPWVDGVVSSSACASAAEETCTAAGACDDASVTVRGDVDAWVSIALDPSGEVLPGQEVGADVSFGNDGTAPVRDLVVRVEVPDGMLIRDAAGGRVDSGAVIFEGLPPVAPGESDARALLLAVRSVLPAEVNVLEHVASVTHARPDAESDPSNDSASAAVTARAAADLHVALERTSGAPTADAFVTYRATVENRGATIARDATLTVTDDDALLLVTGQDPGEFGRVFDLGDVEPGAARTQRLQYRVRRVLPATTNELTTSVRVATSTTDPVTTNDSDSVTDLVAAEADVAVTLALDTGGAPVEPCGRLAATLGWSNVGNTAAADVDFVLSFDPSLVTVVDAGSGVLDAGAGTLTWNEPSAPVGPGGGFTTELDVACVLPSTSTTIPFEARAETPTPDSDPTNDTAAASTTVEACQDVVARVTSVVESPSPAEAAGTLTVTIEVENVGQTAATGVALVGRWSDAAAVDEVVSASPGASASDASSLSWSVPRLEVGDAPVSRTFSLRLAETFPAFENPLTVGASVSALECDLDATGNVAERALVVTARPDLVLTTTVTNETSGTFPAKAYDLLRYDHVVANVGASPGEGVRIVAPWPPSQLDFEAGGPGVSAANGTASHERGVAGLVPGNAWSSWARFSVRPLVPPPIFQFVNRTARAEESNFGTTRDAAPGDNERTSAVPTCFLSGSIVSLASGARICSGSSVTLRAEPVPDGAWQYAWSADSGSFTTVTGDVTTYTPPEGGGDHVVRLVITDPASGCTFETEHVVRVDGNCQACACQSARPNIQYDGDFERLDQPGSRVVEAGETVAFRVLVKESNNSRSAFLLGGPGNTLLSFSGGGQTYEAHLAHDIYIECQSGGWLEFASAIVPEAMPPGQYSLAFDFVTRDDCDEVHSRSDGTGGDRVQVVGPTGASVEVSDWGPVRTDGGRR